MRNPQAEQAVAGIEAGIQTATRIGERLVRLGWTAVRLVGVILILYGIVMGAVHDEIAFEFPWGTRIDPLEYFQGDESQPVATEPPATEPSATEPPVTEPAAQEPFASRSSAPPPTMALPFSLTMIRPGTRERVCVMRESMELPGTPRGERGRPKRRG